VHYAGGHKIMLQFTKCNYPSGIDSIYREQTTIRDHITHPY